MGRASYLLFGPKKTSHWKQCILGSAPYILLIRGCNIWNSFKIHSFMTNKQTKKKKKKRGACSFMLNFTVMMNFTVMRPTLSDIRLLAGQHTIFTFVFLTILARNLILKVSTYFLWHEAILIKNPFRYILTLPELPADWSNKIAHYLLNQSKTVLEKCILWKYKMQHCQSLVMIG